jgi:histidinol-phosphate aminotransferase
MTSLGWEVLPSKANFVFIRKSGMAGIKIFDRLKERGILVRHFSIEGIDDFVRITIGKDDDMDRLVAVCKDSF